MPAAPQNFGAIVLAAGASRRMGTSKTVLPINGIPMIAQIVGRIGGKLLVDPIIVVTGFQPELIREALALLGDGIEFAHNPSPDNGMLSSIKVGLRAMNNRAGSVFIVLGDQPLLEQLTFMKLSAKKTADAMVVRPVFRGKHGHPILIDCRCNAAILALSDDATLNDFVTAPTTRVVDVEVADEAVTFDVDTPDDYQRLTSRPSHREP